MKAVIRTIQIILAFIGLNQVYALVLYIGFLLAYGVALPAVRDLLGSAVSVAVCGFIIFLLQRYYEQKYKTTQLAGHRVLHIGLAGVIGAITVGVLVVAWIVMAALVNL